MAHQRGNNRKPRGPQGQNPGQPQEPQGPYGYQNVRNPGNVDFKDPSKLAEKEQFGVQNTATRNVVLANPNQENPFFDTSVTFDQNGNPTYHSDLTGENKALYEGQVGNATTGTNIANGLLNNFGTYEPNSVNTSNPIPQVNQDYINNYQQAAYKSLTQNLDTNYQQARKDKAQELYDRGISEDSPEWQREMKAEVEDPYNSQRQSAENQAYQSGLQAAQTYQGMGLASHNTAMGDYNQGFSNRLGYAASLNGLGQPIMPSSYQAVQQQPISYAPYGQQAYIPSQLANQLAVAQQYAIAPLNTYKAEKAFTQGQASTSTSPAQN